jgi:hypothetical protein
MDLLLMNVPEKIETQRLILQYPQASYGVKLHEAMLDGDEEKVQWLTSSLFSSDNLPKNFSFKIL